MLAKIHFTIICLQEVANELEVLRIGPQHQAGSDSLLTGQTFFKMKEMFFEDDIDDSKYCGHLYGKNVVLITKTELERYFLKADNFIETLNRAYTIYYILTTSLYQLQ